MMTMKGNHHRKLCMSKTVDEPRGSPKILDDFANDSKSGIRNTLVKGNLNGFLFHLSDCKRIGVLSTSEMYETDTNLYADDSVSGYELPELIVCYKEIDCHVKDICIDQIRYTEDKMMMESGKSASEIAFGKDTSKECFPSANCGATGKVEIPVQEFGAWSYLRSFLKSLNSKGHDDVPKLPNQIPSGNAVLDSPAALLVETEPSKGVQCNSSKRRSIENGAQSFNEQALKARNAHEHVSQVQCDEGELSFSAEGTIPYSGPIAHSRSHSIQSDSSTTSTQSFAFPV